MEYLDYKMAVYIFKCLVVYFVTVRQLASQFTFTGVNTSIADPEVVESCDFSLLKHNGVKKLSGTYAHRTVLQFVEVDSTVDFEYTRDKRTRFLNRRFNVCDFLDGKYENNQLFKRIRQMLTKSKTYRQKCPIPAHHMFKVDLVDIGPLFTGFLPNVTFFATFKMHQKGHLYAQIDLNGFSNIK